MLRPFKGTPNLKFRSCGIFLFVLSMLLCPLSNAADLRRWFEIYPRPSNRNLYESASDGQLWVIVGAAGSVLVSPDGDHWARAIIEPPTTHNLNSVTQNSGRWVAVGSAGLILTSSNAVLWTPAPVSTSENFAAVTFGEDRFIAVGSYGAIASSTNGLDWKMETTPSPFASSLNGVAYGNRAFAAGGLALLQSSENGNLWTPRPFEPNHDIHSVFFDGERFLAGRFQGIVFTSPDATNWISTGAMSATQIRQFARFGQKWFAATGNLMESTNLTNWTARPVPAAYTSSSAGGIYGVTARNGKIVIVGEAGNILTSTDGTNFVQRREARPLPINLAFAHKNRIIAIASSGMIQLDSLNTLTWTERPFNNGSFLARDAYSDTNRAIIVGASLSGLTLNNQIRVSTNGTTWTTIPLTSRGGMNTITYANSTYIAIGAGGVLYTSPNALNWTSNSIPGNPNLNALATDGSRIVAVGPTATNYFTTDLQQWTPVSSGASSPLVAVTWANNLFIAVGNNGSIVTSPDGVAWTPSNNPFIGSWTDIIHHQGQFIIVGTPGVAQSPNGDNWILVPGSPTDLRRLGIIGDDLFAASDTAILTLDDLISRLSIKPAGPDVQIQLTTQVQKRLQIESSTNLLTWTLKTQTTNTYGYQTFHYPRTNTVEHFRALIQ